VILYDIGKVGFFLGKSPFDNKGGAMSYFEKTMVIKRMIEMIDGAVGRWANEAHEIITRAREAVERHNDQDFTRALHNWDRHLVQAPEHVYRQFVMGS